MKSCPKSPLSTVGSHPLWLDPEACQIRLRMTHDPGDELACLALADKLEEGGEDALALAYRWMGWRGARPGFRAGPRIKKCWCWYAPVAYPPEWDRESARRGGNPQAVLPFLVFKAITSAVKEVCLYETWDGAAWDLAKGLEKMKLLLGRPKERGEG